MIDLAYDESSAHIAMGCISINKIGDKWDSYVTSLNLGNLFADTMLLVSAFLRKEFGINAIILNKIAMNKNEYSERNNDISIIRITYMGIIIGYNIFLGGLINEKIKERETNIKHLLYLSGSNSWSYWMSFFIIDFLKLLTFTFLLFIPIYIVLKDITLLFLNLLFVNASSLIFLKFKEKEKFCFIFWFKFKIWNKIPFYIININSYIFNWNKYYWKHNRKKNYIFLFIIEISYFFSSYTYYIFYIFFKFHINYRSR